MRAGAGIGQRGRPDAVMAGHPDSSTRLVVAAGSGSCIHLDYLSFGAHRKKNYREARHDLPTHILTVLWEVYALSAAMLARKVKRPLFTIIHDQQEFWRLS